MKRITLFFICFCFCAFLLNSCSDSPNPVMSDTNKNQESVLANSKPTAPKPEISILEIIKWNEPKNIPADVITIHYKVINAQSVDYMTLAFRYDNDGDGLYRTFFDPYVYFTQIPGNGSEIIDESFNWAGNVYPEFSGNGMLFDQFATANPDRYLFHFSVSGQNFWTYNGQPAEDERVLINPTYAVDPFHATNVEINSSGPKAKKYQLVGKVTCSEAGFKGMGKWEAISGTISCCPNVSFSSDNGNVASTASVTVTKGTYRFYVKNLYSPNYSYKPDDNECQMLNGEPFYEITIP
jgi:hypothetical protein